MGGRTAIDGEEMNRLLAETYGRTYRPPARGRRLRLPKSLSISATASLRPLRYGHRPVGVGPANPTPPKGPAAVQRPGPACSRKTCPVFCEKTPCPYGDRHDP